MQARLHKVPLDPSLAKKYVLKPRALEQYLPDMVVLWSGLTFSGAYPWLLPSAPREPLAPRAPMVLIGLFGLAAIGGTVVVLKRTLLKRASASALVIFKVITFLLLVGWIIAGTPRACNAFFASLVGKEL